MFVHLLDHHRRAILSVVVALALAGLFAGIALPVGLFPVTSFPRIRVVIDAGSMPAKQTLIDVTEPLEEVARAVPGAVNVESTTSRGSAEIFVDFPWGFDMNQALLRVDTALARTLPDLPQGTTYDAIQMSPTAIAPFMSYALISDKVSPVALRRLAKYQLTPLLSGIEGVRRVIALGGQTPEVQVRISPERLAAYGLTLDEVATAISATNSISAVGRLEDNDLLYLAIDNNAFTSLKSVANMALKTPKGGVIRLSDLGSIQMGSVPQWLLVNDNGKPAVTVDVYQQDTADSLTLAKEVDSRLRKFMKTQPASISLVKWYDQTELVRSSIGAVEEAILIGIVFAGLVIWGFLRNWRVTAVAMAIVPASVLITVLLLYALGMSFNIMTLGGIAAAIGLLIDDAIVMIEHIARRSGVPGIEDPQRTVLQAAREFLSPLFGSSFATIVIFVPLAFLSGVTGAFFKFLSLTMASALIISYVLTALVVPLLARSVIDFRTWQDPGHGRETWLTRMHTLLLDRLFARPALIAICVAVLVGLGYLAYTQVGTGFLPQMDEGGFVIDYQTKPGTSLAETNRELSQIDRILKENRYVDTYSRRTGAGLGGDFVEAYQGDYFVKLIAPSNRPPIWTVMDNIIHQITLQVPGVAMDPKQLMGDMIGDMVGRPQPIVVQLSAADPDTLDQIAPNVADAIAKVPGVEPASVNNGVVPAGDALEIHVDPAAAASQGITPDEVRAQIYHYLNGAVVTKYLGEVQDVGVRLWLDPLNEKMHRDQLGQLLIHSPNGRVFPLKQVADVAFVAGQPQITRNNLAQVVPVTAELRGGHDLGSTVTAVRKVLQKPGLLPKGVYYTIGGQYEQQQKAAAGMIRVFAAAAIAEFILLLFLYNRFLMPIVIIATAVVSCSAVFIGLWLTGIEFNITAMMGMVMIIGIGTEMAIFFASEYQTLEQTMPQREALRAAAINRLRPILMSTFAMILALIPLGAAISGSGDQMLQPLAIAIISGIIVQLPMVLLALPVVVGLTVRRAAGSSI
jgi:multidrug efflux pump subunit AcrB